MSNSSDLIKSIVKGNSDLSEDAALDKYLMSRGINPKFATKDQKVAHSKTNAFITWKNNRMIESLTTTQSPVMLKKNLLDKSKRMNKEIHHEETKKDDEYSDPHMAVNQLKTIMHNAEELIEMLGDDTELPEWVESKITLAEDYIMTVANYMRSEMHEEVESIDEISKELTHSYFKKAYAQKYKNEPSKPTKLQMKNRNKGMAKATKRLTNRLELPKGTDPSEGGKYTADSVEHDNATMVEAQSAAVRWQKALEATKKKREEEEKRNAENAKRALTPVKEDKFQDPMAATQTVGMEVDNPSSADRKSQMSKSARIIKSLYKRKGIKEDLYDHEKDDKPSASYGQKPKMSTTKPTDNVGENKPDAAAILSGGKTLTGQTRDTIEIDPMMKKRPGSDPTGKNK
jgi:predicted RNA-binding protein with EMAP domain